MVPKPHEVPHPTLSPDTDPAAERVQLAIYRDMPAWRKFEIVGDRSTAAWSSGRGGSGRPGRLVVRAVSGGGASPHEREGFSVRGELLRA